MSSIIIILLSIAIGMMLGIIFFSKLVYHGPNAKKFCQKIYYNAKTNQCAKFYVKPINCPKKLIF